MALDIVQGTLSESEIQVPELDDSWGGNANISNHMSMEMVDPSDSLGEQDILNADTSSWDPFDDADKFERLAAA